MEKLSLEEVHIDELLQYAFSMKARELYLEAGEPPFVRLSNQYSLKELQQYQVVRKCVVQRIIYDILSDELIVQLEQERSLIFSYTVADGSRRFHVHAASTQEGVRSVFHVIDRNLV